MKDLNFIIPVHRPVAVRVHTSPKMMIGVFVCAFTVLILLFNGPMVASAVKYPLSNLGQSEEERLTAQYRALYGDHQSANSINQTIGATDNNSNPILNNNVVALPITGPSEISIPKIGVTAPIIQVNSVSDAVILNALKTGVVLYPGSADPGSGGTTVIVGHSSSNPPWTKYSAIFSLLGKLTPDDVIVLTFQGREYSYRIRAIEHGSVEQLLSSGLAGDLVLSTCWPIGTDQGRIVVTANLIPQN